MTDLSPAAQAVLDATSDTFGNYQFTARGQMIAAALRAAADLVVPHEPLKGSDPGAWERDDIRNQILAIAAELEGQ
jgi:hypothetical protein